MTKKVAYPLPRTEDTFDHLQSSLIFSKLDAAAGYWQIPLDKPAREKSAIVTPDGQFEWLVMPFGLCNAPSTFQKLMDTILKDIKWKYCMVYLDDILIFSKSWEEHLEQLRVILQRLLSAGISLKLSKCEFGNTSIQYLGHVIKKASISPDPENVRAITEFPRPTNLTALKSYLGMLGYYRRFLPKFSDIIYPLQLMLKKNAPFIWKQEQKRAFEESKKLLLDEPVLRVPDFHRQFIIKTNASNVGISAIFAQIDQDNQEYAIFIVPGALMLQKRNIPR